MTPQIKFGFGGVQQTHNYFKRNLSYNGNKFRGATDPLSHNLMPWRLVRFVGRFAPVQLTWFFFRNHAIKK